MPGVSARTKVVSLRVPNEEHAGWETAAKIAGIPLSEHILELARAGDRAVEPIPVSRRPAEAAPARVVQVNTVKPIPAPIGSLLKREKKRK